MYVLCIEKDRDLYRYTLVRPGCLYISGARSSVTDVCSVIEKEMAEDETRELQEKEREEHDPST